MKLSLSIACLSVLVAACSPSGSADGAANSKGGRSASVQEATPLTVVEIFQSQGCFSCPPANANVNAIAQDDDVLALSFAVTYWDRLGWKDRFAKPEFTQRERDYASRDVIIVATPQVVVNGNYGPTGHKEDELADAIRDAQPLEHAPSIEIGGNTITIGEGQIVSSADIWLVRYDPREQLVSISAGENNGKTLPHRNIVTEIEKLGSWTGAPLTLPIKPRATNGLQSALLVQEEGGGAIIAAKRL